MTSVLATTHSGRMSINDDDTPTPSSRRTMLRRAAALGATLGVAGAVASTATAEAADGDDLKLGVTNVHTTATNVNFGGPTVAASMNIQSGDQSTGRSTSSPASPRR